MTKRKAAENNSSSSPVVQQKRTKIRKTKATANNNSPMVEERTLEEPTRLDGSSPGDWHPSQIDRDKLQKLLCCVFTFWNKKKAKAQELSAEVKKKQDQLKFISNKI